MGALGILIILFIIGYNITDRPLGGVCLNVSLISALMLCMAIYKILRDARFRRDEEHKTVNQEKHFQFLAIVSSMLAKMAKADGVVDASEIKVAEQAFKRFGVYTPDLLRYCVNVFRMAKDDGVSLNDYADMLLSATGHETTRLMVYELLWDIAAADSVLADEEASMLRDVLPHLQLDEKWYEVHYQRRFARGQRQEQNYDFFRKYTHPLAEAYATMGCDPSDSDDELRTRYRMLAMKCHPDHLRQDGVPATVIRAATERMARINAAWDKIRKARGIS